MNNSQVPVAPNNVATASASTSKQLDPKRADPILNKTQLNTVRRLEVLKKFADKFAPTTSCPTPQGLLERQLSSTLLQRRCVVCSKLMQVFVLDIKSLFEQRPPSNVHSSSSESLSDENSSTESTEATPPPSEASNNSSTSSTGSTGQPTVTWQTPIAHFSGAPPELSCTRWPVGSTRSCCLVVWRLIRRLPGSQRTAL